MSDPVCSRVEDTAVCWLDEGDTDGIDQRKIDAALERCRMDLDGGGSALAEALRDPNLNERERDQLLRALIHEGRDQQRAFFAHDSIRMAVGTDPKLGSQDFRDCVMRSLRADQQTIANAVQEAYDRGAISRDDLLQLADAFATRGNSQQFDSAQRFMSMLRQSSMPAQTQDVAEVLAHALWERNGGGGADRAAAAIHFTSAPALMARNLDTPTKRAEAFQALVEFHDVSSSWQQQDLAKASARLFTAHGQELIDRYTRLTPTQAPETEMLAKFMSQTVFNPDAKAIALDQHRELVSAVRDALADAANTFLARARQAPADSMKESEALEQFGRLTASISGGAAVALTAYDEKSLAYEQARQQVVDVVSMVAGKAAGKGGDLAAPVAGAIAKAMFDALIKAPERPGAALAGVIQDELATQIDGLRKQLNRPEWLRTYSAAFSDELLNLQLNLNVNLGAHRK